MGNRYSRYKIFHYKEKVDSLPREVAEIRPPVHVRIKPTNVCAHHCWYCAYRVDNLQLGQDMVERDSIPREKMLEIIDDLEEMGVQAVTFSGGGDPFYYKHLAEAVRRLADSPIRFASLTNGARLSGELAELFAHHATWLRISIDGWDEPSYQKYRGVKEGEFTRVVGNMEAFAKLGGGCALGVSLIVDQTNAGHVYDFVAHMKGVGVHSVKVSPCIVSNDGEENDRYHEPIFKLVREQVDRALADIAAADFEIFDAYHAHAKEFTKPYHWCPYLQVLPVIGADLNIYPCQDKAYNLDTGLLGSIRDQRFRDFWLSDKNRFFSIDPSRVCNHHCVADGKNRMILEYLANDPDHLGFV